jgi:hypothetical protein
MSQRTIPGFEPSPEAYRPAVEAIEDGQQMFERYGVTADYAMDLYTAFIAGLVAQQVANDPGGARWKRQVDRAMDAFCDAVGIAPTKPRKSTTRGKR